VTVSMTWPGGARGAGVRPSVEHVPPHARSAGGEAADLARLAGTDLLPWEERALEVGLAEREDGSWAAREVGLAVSRQNGKGEVLQVRELAGLFLFGERSLIHSAHLFSTSLEAFRRMRAVLEGTPEFSRRLKRNGIRTANGDESIELAAGPSPDGLGRQQGARLQYKARTKGGAGRGFTVDGVLVLDEAMYLAEMVHGALMPLVSSKPNAQVWYAGSAVDRSVHEEADVFARVRRRAMRGDDPSLAYLEWSAEEGATLADAERLMDDEDAWARANPAFPDLISREAILAERRSMSLRSFAVERLGIGDWPDEQDLGRKIALSAWRDLIDVSSEPQDPVWFAVDVSPDQRSAAIGVAGRREDGLRHVEVVDHRAGTGWVADRAAEVATRHAGRVVVDGAGPAAALIPALVRAGVEVRKASAQDMARACGLLHSDVTERGMRHLGTPELDDALRAAAVRKLGDAWAWTRGASGGDITPLVAVTLALWGLDQEKPVPAFSFVFDTYE
jgi:hypothetical protein